MPLDPIPGGSTYFACGCVIVDGVRDVKKCTDGHTSETVAEPHAAPMAVSDHRIKDAEAALARGEEPVDTRTDEEKQTDTDAAAMSETDDSLPGKPTGRAAKKK